MFNSLESRRLLAVSASLVAGKLSITGTSAAEVISVNLSGGSIKVVSGASTTSFPASAVQSITANLLGGNDKIAISTSIFKPTSIKGGTGNDTIIGGNGNDILRGEAGKDSLIGNAGNDLLDGNLDVDNLQGGKGNDTFTSGTGDDSIDGGAGSDTVDYSSRLLPIHFYLNPDTQETSKMVGAGGEQNENDTFSDIETGIGGHSDDTLSFSDYPDNTGQSNTSTASIKLTGGPGHDELSIYGYTNNAIRNVTLDGGAGNDTLRSSQFGNKCFLYGGDGNDDFLISDGLSIWYGPGLEEPSYRAAMPKLIDGGTGTDFMQLTHLDSYADDFSGVPKTYHYGPVSFSISGSIENAEVYSDTAVKIIGNNLNNHIVVSSHYQSTVLGGAGNDTLEVDNSYRFNNPDYPANSGPATLLGGDGNDSIIGSKFNDSIDGGDGSDTVDYSARVTPVKVYLTIFAQPDVYGDGGEGAEQDHYSSVETIIGGQSDDSLSLSHFVSTIYDTPYVPDLVVNGNYELIGGPGNDRLQDGGDGPLGLRNVTLDGGSGNDSIYAAQTPDVCYLFGGDGDDLLSTADGYPGYSGPDDQGDSQFLSMPKLVNGGSGIDFWNLSHIDQLNSNGFTEYYDNPITYTLPDSIENAYVDSDSSIKFIGNWLDNHITISSQFRSTLLGMAGNDTLEVENRYYSEDHPGYGSYNNGPVSIYGGDGDDRIIGSKFNDLLDGQSGNDFIDGGAGNDIITGGLGQDSLFGNLGNDTFYANDKIIDLINGGPGTDKARTDALDQLVRVEKLF